MIDGAWFKKVRLSRTGAMSLDLSNIYQKM